MNNRFAFVSRGLPSSFNYVACLPVGRYWLWGKTPGGLKKDVMP